MEFKLFADTFEEYLRKHPEVEKKSFMVRGKEFPAPELLKELKGRSEVGRTFCQHLLLRRMPSTEAFSFSSPKELPDALADNLEREKPPITFSTFSIPPRVMSAEELAREIRGRTKVGLAHVRVHIYSMIEEEVR
jgi:hypothetical protein